MGNTEFFRETTDLQKDFKWSEIFSEMTKNHSEEQKDRVLVSGCKTYMPSESRMLKEWQKPFLFFRFGVIGFIFVAILAILNIYSGAVAFYPMYMVSSAFVVPVTILILIWEMNVPRNISIIQLFKYVMYAGMISIFLTFVFRGIFLMTGDLPGWITAPIPEELGKFVMVYLIVKKLDCKYVLNGLLIGCAVGVGFSAQESAGYAFSLWQEGGDISMYLNSITRGIWAVCGHEVWAAAYGAALVFSKKNEPLKMAHVATPQVLGAFFISVAFHTAWNFPLETLMGNSMIGIAKSIALTIASWVIVFRWMRTGLVQIVETCTQAAGQSYAYPKIQQMSGVEYQGAVSQRVTIQCVRGALAGKSFEIGSSGAVLFGRDANAMIRFPQNTKGISGRHCEIMSSNGKFVIVDRGSTYGTYLVDGRKLEPNVPYDVKNGTIFYLASRENKFEIKM